MRVVIAGASGLVGTALTASLRADGAEVVALVRKSAAGPGEITWDPAAGKLNPDSLEGCDAVVNLSGENVAEGSWSDLRKKRILESRVGATRTLVEALGKMDHPPATLLSASAIGFYGDTGEGSVSESAPVGKGFLAGVCEAWESEALRAKHSGVRVVFARLGVVLSTQGGALAKMLTPFRLGLGGPLGDGTQYISWVTLGDTVRALKWCLSRKDIHGPVNLVAPHPVTNREFTRTLAAELHRPALFAAPKFALRFAMGEMADEMLLSSARILPTVLKEGNFDFEHPQLQGALHHLIAHGE
ncbi:MAG: hypothetical protein RLZZ303_930 [Candidatus Hydrogenedentota bacterium]|jgi:uncharacterized protein (TIGR01777 family)